MRREPILLLAGLGLLLATACPTDPDDDDSAVDDDDSVQVDDDDSGATGDDDDAASPDRRGFILIHCDPQEMLNLHGNLIQPFHDWNGDEVAEPLDMWLALMDLVDMADSFGHALTLQFSAPYADFIGSTACDDTLVDGRIYPAGTGKSYAACTDLASAWEAAGHELSIHHHGPNHDPVKFDGYTNQPLWDTNGQRPCLDDGGATCACPMGDCPLCTAPASPLVCTDVGDPPQTVGTDPEWVGPIEGPGGLMAALEATFGEGAFTSLCMNHGDETTDMPMDPNILFTTNGGGLLNDLATLPRCVGHDPAAEFHPSTRYAWFFQHLLLNQREQLDEVRTWLDGGDDGQASGVVFHVGDFTKSELADDGQDVHELYRDLMGMLTDPDGDPATDDAVRIIGLSDLGAELGKTELPDPCVETCWALDPSEPMEANYTDLLDPPADCP